MARADLDLKHLRLVSCFGSMQPAQHVIDRKMEFQTDPLFLSNVLIEKTTKHRREFSCDGEDGRISQLCDLWRKRFGAEATHSNLHPMLIFGMKANLNGNRASPLAAPDHRGNELIDDVQNDIDIGPYLLARRRIEPEVNNDAQSRRLRLPS